MKESEKCGLSTILSHVYVILLIRLFKKLKSFIRRIQLSSRHTLNTITDECAYFSKSGDELQI